MKRATRPAATAQVAVARSWRGRATTWGTGLLGSVLLFALAACSSASSATGLQPSLEPGYEWDCELVGGAPGRDPDEYCQQVPTPEMVKWMTDPCWFVPPEEAMRVDEECRAYFGNVPPYIRPRQTPAPPPTPRIVPMTADAARQIVAFIDRVSPMHEPDEIREALSEHVEWALETLPDGRDGTRDPRLDEWLGVLLGALETAREDGNFASDLATMRELRDDFAAAADGGAEVSPTASS